MAGSEIEEVPDAELVKGCFATRNAFENKCVEAIVRGRVIAGQGFVDEQRQSLAVRNLGRMREGVVLLHAPIHQRPIENIPGIGARRTIVEDADALGGNSHYYSSTGAVLESSALRTM